MALSTVPFLEEALSRSSTHRSPKPAITLSGILATFLRMNHIPVRHCLWLKHMQTFFSHFFHIFPFNFWAWNMCRMSLRTPSINPWRIYIAYGKIELAIQLAPACNFCSACFKVEICLCDRPHKFLQRECLSACFSSCCHRFRQYPLKGFSDAGTETFV